MPVYRKSRLSRREFLILAGGTASATVLGACTPSASVADAVTPTVELEPKPTKEVSPLIITIVYNNIAHDARLDTPWGFAALIEYGNQQVLFDTGGDSPTLLGNMEILEKDPSTIQKVVLSHIHDDHVGGLHGLLETGVRPAVYVPPSFPRSFKDSVSDITELVEVTAGLEIAKEMFTTGEMPGPPAEQSLAVRSRAGLIVITGCAHPGIVEIVRQAKELVDEPVFLAMGGFHLGDRRESQIASILTDLRELGVQRVAPSHCTGEEAINMFAKEYGDKFIRSGAGTVITI
jgi:7,8-dihydropterin-6-yl-methyl-4-(beta-D-ribofuranosyl)aminobenzene 5'-phosphate synthase